MIYYSTISVQIGTDLGFPIDFFCFCARSVTVDQLDCAKDGQAPWVLNLSWNGFRCWHSAFVCPTTTNIRSARHGPYRGAASRDLIDLSCYSVWTCCAPVRSSRSHSVCNRFTRRRRIWGPPPGSPSYPLSQHELGLQWEPCCPTVRPTQFQCVSGPVAVERSTRRKFSPSYA